MTPEQLRAMTGQDNYQGGSKLVLNEILINGDGDIEEVDGKYVHKGGYYRKRVWVGKEGDGKPEDINLGKTVNTVWLKVRRKLVQRSTEGKIVRSTTEHNTVNDTISVFEGKEKVFTGTAQEARTKYEGLRTVQVVYALLLDDAKEPELVRITIKGASLGSEARPKELLSFYQYLSSFGKDSITNFVTSLGVVLEQGKKKYYTMTFDRGVAVSGELAPVVIEKLTFVHEHTSKVDARKVEVVSEAPSSDTDQYPTDEEIDPSQIPF